MSNSQLLATKHSLIDGIFDQVRRHYLSHQPTADNDENSPSYANHYATASLPHSHPPAQHLISDQLLSDLFFAFQTPLEHALDLIDKAAVTRLVNRLCPDHFVLQVVGSSGSTYTCFPESPFCTCPFYKFSVLRKEEFIMCKHAIAVRLALCLDAYKDVEISPAEFAKLLTEI